jgi:hypothetical protein
LKKAIGPTREARKTKTLAEIDSFESDNNDSDGRLFGGNNDISHAKAPDDSNYSKGNERSIEKSFLWATMLAFAFL